MPTFQSRRNWSDKRKESVRRGLRRSWQPGGAHHERFLNRPADADTVRKRALWDRRGKECAYFNYTLTATIPGYVVRHSVRRTDAYEVIGTGGKVVCSGGRVVVGRFLGALLP